VERGIWGIAGELGTGEDTTRLSTRPAWASLRRSASAALTDEPARLATIGLFGSATAAALDPLRGLEASTCFRELASSSPKIAAACFGQTAS
jgi:hypothetical protein